MQATIQKLELKRRKRKPYIKIELLDEYGNKYIIDKPYLNDEINFRKQVFGILCACNCFDLMKLATNNPKKKEMIGYYQNRLQMLENEQGQWFKYDKDKKAYTCEKPKRKTRKIFNYLVNSENTNITLDKGHIEAIISQSNTFQLLFTSKLGSTFYTAGQIYFGFGYPLLLGNDVDENIKEESAKLFTSFITSLMKLYGINDILKFGGIIDSLPTVEISLNANNEVTTITNLSTGFGLSIQENYEIINNQEKNNLKRNLVL